MIGVMKGQADVTWDLVMWWKFLGSEQTVVKDYSGNGYNGDSFDGAVSKATYQDGVIGQAWKGDGDDTYILTGNIPIVDEFTFEVWIRKESDINLRGILGNYYNGGGKYGAVLTAVESTVLVYSGDGVGNQRISIWHNVITDDTWYHLILTYDGTDFTLYRNGVQFGASIAQTVAQDVSTKVLVGQWSSDYLDHYAFKGLIDEARIYTRILSTDEIGWRYANTNPAVGKPTRMIAVDSEGRMRVNVEGLPYKSQVAYRDTEFWAAAGDHFFISDAVPEGKLWVITTALVTTTGTKCNELVTAIYHAGQYYTIEYEYNAGACNTQKLKGQIIMSAGDVLVFTINGAVAGATGICGINGYELDVD
jgi:hypothetical protein